MEVDDLTIAYARINFSSYNILDVLEALGHRLDIPGDGSAISFKAKNMALLAMRNLDLKNITIFSPDDSTRTSICSLKVSTVDSTTLMEANGSLSSSIRLPSSLFSDTSEHGNCVFAFVHRNSKFFVDGAQLKRLLNSSEAVPKLNVTSDVISATVGNRTLRNLIDPVVITFKKRSPGATGRYTCRFWDVAQRK